MKEPNIKKKKNKEHHVTNPLPLPHFTASNSHTDIMSRLHTSLSSSSAILSFAHTILVTYDLPYVP
jgi:hypothetical protein